jgi:LacI family transcriptional regulator
MDHVTDDRISPSVTVSDVASLAGVSTATVSRVLNDSSSVAPRTALRVVDAIRTLGYQRNDAATALRRGRTTDVVLVVDDRGTRSAQSRIGELAGAIARRGLSLRVECLENDGGSLDGSTGAWGSGPPAAFVVAVSQAEISRTTAHLARYPEVPVVVVGPHPSAPASWIPVFFDDRAALDDLVLHLRAGGRSRYVLLNSASPSGLTDDLAEVNKAVTEAAVAVWRAPSESAEAGYRTVSQRLLAARSGFDAVIAASDELAIGCMRALAEHGVDVPGDVAVAGIGDIPVAAYLPGVSLTTLRGPMGAFGDLVADAVDALRKGESVRAQPVARVLIARESTGFG